MSESKDKEKYEDETEDWDPIAELLFDITEQFGLEADIEYEERKDHVRYHIEGPDMGVLIGRRGSTLNALQFLIGVINARKKLVDYRVVVDVESYRDRREKQLIDQAKRDAARVAREGREKVMSAMPASERRVVHLALADWDDVVTYSEGKDPDRCVVIAPKDDRDRDDDDDQDYDDDDDRDDEDDDRGYDDNDRNDDDDDRDDDDDDRDDDDDDRDDDDDDDYDDDDDDRDD